MAPGVTFEVNKIERETVTLEVLNERGEVTMVGFLGIEGPKTITLPRTGSLRTAQPGDRFELVPVREE